MRKKISRIITTAICLVMMVTTVLFASPMKDIGSKHWAYDEIMEMQRRGLLVTSSQGEFFPNHYVTYFELSQILAKATGYKDADINTNIDPAFKKAIEANYAKQEPIIEANQKNYKYWQKDVNDEIAYLLGKGYLEKEDLGRFMSKSTSGEESKRGVRKQEAVVYLVRILHKAETAKGEYTSTGFIDEGSIDADFRPYVAYAKKLGLINGNDKGEFKPATPVTRATLSKMLIDTLKIKETPSDILEPVTPVTPVNPVTPIMPTDKGLEGRLTKMISKGDNGYYIVLEVDPSKIHTYSIEPTAIIVDKNGIPLSLAALKQRIDKADNKVNVTAQISLIGTTEYMTNVRLFDSVENTVPVEERPIVEERPVVNDTTPNQEDMMPTQVIGNIYSVLMAPTPEITVQLSSGNRTTYKVNPNTQIYNALMRREVSLWDIRLNQEVELEVQSKEVKTLEITREAPPVTLTGTITKTSINGDQIDIKVHYDSITQQSNVIRTVNIPMITQITDDTIQRGRKDLVENMEVVVVFGENGSREPEKIVILGK